MKIIARSTIAAVFKSQCYRTLSQYPQQRENRKKSSHFPNKSVLVGSVAIGVLGYHFFINRKRRAYADFYSCETGSWRKDLPTYTKEDVGKHSTKKKRIWVCFKEGVYDITDYLVEHPGGDQILLAAGSSLEEYYRLYGFHEMAHVMDRLEQLRIGNLAREDQTHLSDYDDPYVNEHKPHCDTEAITTRPYCGGVKLKLLADQFYTPNEFFYVRNHLPVPELDALSYEFHLEVEGTEKRLTFNMTDIRRLPKCIISCSLMCSGNRRSEMMKTVNRRLAVNWGPNGMSNAKWTGVKLRDLLKMVDITEGEKKYKHVQFEGWDFEANGTQYGGSIPISKAVDINGDVILAYEMNGVPLPPEHGFPLRVIVPGHTGARSVKWLARILVSKNESPCHYQQIDYKSFPPSTTWKTADYKAAPALQVLPVNSAICRPSEGDDVRVEDGCIEIKGYSYVGGGQKIIRVDVSIDKGKTWQVANLDHQDSATPPRHWSWTLWSLKVPVDPLLTEIEIWCKAVDSHFNTQPEKFDNIFNFKGVLCNAYHRVKVTLNH